MTGRIVDASGAAWPITGLRCTLCRLPLDRVLADLGTHPGCMEEPELLADPEMARRIRYIGDVLGAVTIRTNQQKETQ